MNFMLSNCTRTALLGAALLAGCASNPTIYTNASGDRAPDQVVAECDLQATTATAAMLNGIEAGFMHVEIMRKCLRVKGYTPR